MPMPMRLRRRLTTALDTEQGTACQASRAAVVFKKAEQPRSYCARHRCVSHAGRLALSLQT
jgi:hypothetical protein